MHEWSKFRKSEKKKDENFDSKSMKNYYKYIKMLYNVNTCETRSYIR